MASAKNKPEKLWLKKTGDDLWAFVIALTFPLYLALAVVMISILAVGK